MAKPSGRIPTWATAGGADIVDPGAPQQADGWDVDDKPPAGWMNWWKNRVGAWVEYLDALANDLDLKNWTPGITATMPGDFADVAFGAAGGPGASPLFMAIDYDGFAYTSYDGLDWQKRGQPTTVDDYRGECLHFEPGIGWIQGGTNGTSVSTDYGDTWTEGTFYASSEVFSIGGNGSGTAVAVVNNGTGIDIKSSVDGLTWTVRQNVASVSIGLGIPVFAGGKFVVMGPNLSAQDPHVYTSPDGITWTNRTSLFVLPHTGTDIFHAVTYSAAAGKWFALGRYMQSGSTGSKVEIWETTNPDAVAWTLSFSSTEWAGLFNINSYASMPGLFMGTLDDGRIFGIVSFESEVPREGGGTLEAARALCIVSSDDGATWSEFEIPAFYALGCATDGARLVRAGSVDNYQAGYISATARA